MKDGFLLLAAPLQGFTEAEWRVAHNRVAGGVSAYFAPFMRIEKGEVRRRDLRDIDPARNRGVAMVPQAICKDAGEFAMITDAVAQVGYSRLDLNLGCPFRPQVKHGRGAGLLINMEALDVVAEEMLHRPDMRFSVKMRPGVNDPGDWRRVADIINRMPLEYVTVHPRVAAQQYGGELHADEFAAIGRELRHDIVFNGDVAEPKDIDRLREQFPGLRGVMAGRGLLSRPTLFAEWLNGQELSLDERRREIRLIHSEMIGEYEQRLCGESQLLMKIKPYWEYAGCVFDRKRVKRVMKAGNLAAYLRAVDEL